MKVTTGLYSVVAVSVLATFSACSNTSDMPPQEIAGGMAVSAAGTVASAGTVAPTGVAGTVATAGVAASAVGGTSGAAGTIAVAGSSAIAGAAAAGTSGAAGTTGAAGAATGAAGAAGGAAGAPAPGAGTFTAVLAIFSDPAVNCGLCHGMPTIGGGLIFKPSDVAGTYAALVGPVSKGMLGSQCAGKTYVVPGMPDASLLYDKLSKATPTCGARMPANGDILTDAQLATVRAWIMAGAKNN